MRRTLANLFPCLIVLVLLGLPIATRADTPTPSVSYKQIAPDGKFVFVMISPHPVERDPGSMNEEYAARIREIRRLYSKSGMYRNDGSAEPLWSVDWFAQSVKLAPDGVHVVREGPWAFLRGFEELEAALDQEAISFFANGRLLRTYQIRELIKNEKKLSRSISHVRWKKDAEFDHARLEYTLRTLDGNEFVFDIQTGAIVSESRPGWFSQWGWRVAFGVLGVAAIGWLVLRRRRRAHVVLS